MLLEKQASGSIYGVQVKLWFGIGVMTFAFFLLANIHNDVEFNIAISFIIIFLISVSYLFHIEQRPSKKAELASLDFFWMHDMTKNALKWVGISLALVFMAVVLSIMSGSSLVGIGISGGIMMYAFFKTNSILVPIITHGTYNSFVVAVKRSGLDVASFFSTSPIKVPEVGLGIQGLSSIYSEIIWQFMLVATAEEVMKIAITVFVTIAIANNIKAGKPAYMGAFVAIAVWTGLHTVQGFG